MTNEEVKSKQEMTYNSIHKNDRNEMYTESDKVKKLNANHIIDEEG